MTSPDVHDGAIHLGAIHLGANGDRYEGRIDGDAAIAYALATNDPNEIYLRGVAVPPLYTVSLIQAAFVDSIDRGVEPGAIHGSRGGVHGEHDVRLVAPVLPGAAVQWHAGTHSARQTAAGVRVTQRIEVSDALGVPLVEHYWSTLYLGGRIERDLGPDLPDHSLPSAARARVVGTHTFMVSGDQTFRYAGASTDHNPHSVDDEAARREGFPGKIVQGLCTLAMCSGAVVEVGAGGDPHRLLRLAGRFSSPVFPRQELVVTVYDLGRTEAGDPALGFEAVSDGTVVVKHGRAELLSG